MKRTLAALSLALLPSTALAADGDIWVNDFDKAIAMAKEQNKDLFVDFTGSDWCHWCIKLHEEVFAYEAWSDEASKGYILVSLDFPRNDEAKAAVPNPERNAELAEQYGVPGYPTVLLMNADGDVFARLPLGSDACCRSRRPDIVRARPNDRRFARRHLVIWRIPNTPRTRSADGPCHLHLGRSCFPCHASAILSPAIWTPMATQGIRSCGTVTCHGRLMLS